MDKGSREKRVRAAKSQTGVTLLELMVVIAIVGILAAFATPISLQWRANRYLSNGAREIHAAIQYARLQAVKQNANVVINFNIANDSYTVSGSGTLRSGTLEGVDITSANFSGNTFVTFNYRGFANAGMVTLQGSNGDTRQVVVLSTGNSQIQ